MSGKADAGKADSEKDPVENVVQANSQLEKQVSELAASYDKLAKSYGIKSKSFAPTRTASYSNLNEMELTQAPEVDEGEEPAPPPEDLIKKANEKIAEKLSKKEELSKNVAPTSKLLPPEERMKVVIVASEVAPFSKSGGLADVSDKLGVALSKMGHKVMTVAPLYWRYDGVETTGKWKEFQLFNCKYRIEYFHKFQETVPATNGMPAQGIDHVFVQQGCYERWGMYGHSDDLQRFALLSWAALEAPFAVECDNGQAYGDDVVFLVNDWMVGLVPLIMTSHYRRYGCYDKARTVFDIHNMGYCGNFKVPDPQELGLPDGAYFDTLFHDRQIKLLKGGIEMADRVVTVSPSYKEEILSPEGGFGLHDCCRGRYMQLDGVLNGIDTDEWNPETDHYLSAACQGYDNFFSVHDLAGKKGAKLHLQATMHLQEHGDCPIICFVGRLAHQKGIDVLCSVLDWLMTENNGVTGWVQVVCMGTGSDEFANLLRNTAGRYHGKIVAHIGFTPELEHKIIAGSDILVMPSRYEPCGLPQMYAQRYGTIPVVHATGGLKDSVEQYDPFGGENGGGTGTGWKFDRCDGEGLKFGLWHALDTYKNHKEAWKAMVKRAMETDFSWDNAAKRYLEIFNWAKIDPPHHQPARF
eukprot:Tamp_09262.p1 GENE.Tamp_09262~~Tamp_09262.p1  ORF type:complete len:705 (-),score=126.08 Tamp_09262:87-2000(-)